MALNNLVDTRDVQFVLYELLNVEKMTEFPRYAEFDKDTFDATIELAEQIAMDVIFPCADEGEKVGAQYNPEDKSVKIPDAYRQPLDAYYDAGFFGIYDNPEIGGMGMPNAIGWACNEYICAACYPMMMYPGLSHGSMELVEVYGTPEQQEMYIPKLMTGEWGGTMCLTEPDAGSDVGALKTKAVRQSDGTYKITGNKIFISTGENDYYKNMIHPVLARIEGDPAGTKGISIFIVPKYLVNEDGSLGEFNDVTCSGIEHKMGIHGQPTSQLSFGDNGNCRGFLLGEERQGMKIMFKMMNFARMGVALQGHANSSAAYMHTITYTKNRIQGVHVKDMMNPDAKGVNIVNHPDVKRMLLWMKSYLEGQRALIYFMYMNLDIMECGNEEEVKEAKGLVELLTPICKAGCTDKGVEICSEAMQCYGGYGYCADYPIERMMRDSKILAIWEGTNGIQSMDLTMRKILMNKDQYNYNAWKKRVGEAISDARGVVEDKYIDIVQRGMDKCDEVIEMLKAAMASGKFLHLFMHATPLQQAMYMLALAWCHLWMLTLALPKMQELVGDKKGEDREALLNDNAEAAYYTGKVLSSQFYLLYEFPKYFGRMECLMSGESAVIKATNAIFTGAPEE